MLVSDLRAGGAERVASTLVNAWADRRSEVQLVATYSEAVERVLPISDGVRFIRLADFDGCKGRSPIAYVRRIFRLRTLIRSMNPDVMVMFLTNVNLLGLIASAGLGLPRIVSERVDPISETESSRLLRCLRWALYPFADAIAAQTRRAAESVAGRVARPPMIAVIPNPLPVALLTVERRIASADGRRRIMAVGRLTSQKRFDLLIDAFALIAARFQEWDLWIRGEGELLAALQKQVARLGLTDRVFMPGTTSKIWQEIADSDVFALASDFEGFPNALLEAMALGVACTATDCVSGPRELSRHGELAILVPPGRPDALAAALEHLMSDDDLRSRLGRAAADSVRRDYALTEILAQWDSLFLTVCR